MLVGGIWVSRTLRQAAGAHHTPYRTVVVLDKDTIDRTAVFAEQVDNVRTMLAPVLHVFREAHHDIENLALAGRHHSERDQRQAVQQRLRLAALPRHKRPH